MTRRLGLVPVDHDDPGAPAGCAALRPLRDVPLVRRAVGALVRSDALDEVVVATPPALLEPVAALTAGMVPVRVHPVQGNGPGLRVCAVLATAGLADDDVVVVHDPLHPLAPAALVRAVVEELAREPTAAVVPVRPVTDTLKRVDEDDVVTGTVDREGFRMVYSPQAYRAGMLAAALAAADDAALRQRGAQVLPRLVQQVGGRLASVLAPGEVFRVGTAEDLVLAEAMLQVGADVDDEPGS